MGDLIDLLDNLSEKYKFSKEDVDSLGAVIAKMKGQGRVPELESNGEFDYMEKGKPQGGQEEMGEAE